MRLSIVSIVLFWSFMSCTQAQQPDQPMAAEDSIEPVNKSEAEWREELTAEEYHILREKGTERAYTGKYHDLKKEGVYKCAACGLPVFSSEAKFHSGTGWPSYYEPIAADHVKEVPDHSDGMTRTEIVCARCDSHLGHVFKDGPEPTGLRYCINSVALDFEAASGEMMEK